MPIKKSDIETLNKDLQKKNQELEKAFEELDRRVYHLKTLNDISRDIFSTVEFRIHHRSLSVDDHGQFRRHRGLCHDAEPCDR